MADPEFQALCDGFFAGLCRFYPNRASIWGLHGFDGQLPDLRRGALEQWGLECTAWLDRLATIDTTTLERLERFDRDLLELRLKQEVWGLHEQRWPHTCPTMIADELGLHHLMLRDFAPLPERVTSIIAQLEATPGYLAAWQANLDEVLPRAQVEMSVQMLSGMAEFYRSEVVQDLMPDLEDQVLVGNLKGAIEVGAKAIEDLVRFLEAEALPRARPEFAIGSNQFAKMILYDGAVDLDLDHLLAIGEAFLEEEQTEYAAAAREIDAQATIPEIAKRLTAHHPTAESLIPDTVATLDKLRQWVIDNDIVSVPSMVQIQVYPTPKFLRAYAMAACDSPGPFEEVATEAFYYVSPPEPEWSAEEQEGWLRIFHYASLEDITVHEAWPGHYLHFLHVKSAPTKLSKVLGAYHFWEGWGLYVEEMMRRQGYRDDPEYRIAQLTESLLRTVRFICAIRMHTKGMTVEEATQMFKDEAHYDDQPAGIEARRGTFDAGYLNYTLGKLLIWKLRRDWEAENPGKTLKEFHDELLAWGAPPIPVLRKYMLREPGEQIL